MQPEKNKKLPISVLVLLHDYHGNVLLLNRLNPPDFWQSVTGSLDDINEPPFQAALREVFEETGIILPQSVLRDWYYCTEYEIYAHWRHRYADGVTHNMEHWFSAAIDVDTPIVLSEHSAYQWLPAHQAAEKVFSPSNREIILQWVKQGFQAALS
ncbi:dihydroneopterin triphosphate diphosphatase [Wielerella bovis]|uniref:dihydroneopterin triphosphate diphosphatase n=1 Tax=Wielerella bovis TaxID=2917790 RepID=UPI00201873D8|nr:dihydroneopterin triphosphate diphosphatase [Wielerella bovis]MCG7657376.1 dihydroneopterin triphosphate diphosphatase [Wielerella bovis]MCG7659597.1 dihydroneopterin triphosphate diphosphatase [Wielerella bovis]